MLSPEPRTQRTLTLLTLIAAAAACLGYWLWQAHWVSTLPDAPSDHLASVSYAPFREGQSPLDESLVVPPEQIEQDLRQLAQRLDSVRTYSVDQGLSEVPRIAERYGLKVYLGIWIGRNPVHNQAQIEQGIATALRYRNTIRGIIVGNEVLLRGEQPPSVLKDYLLQVKTATGLPVSYADVWEFWNRAPELADAVDFITIHILPYWEDQPVPVAQALAHVLDIYREMQAHFPGKTLMIGETGWPSRGRTRQGAVPSLINQAHFIREFAATATRIGMPYNVIEAYDQAWKRRQEGTVGGTWGLYDTYQQPKFPFRGPVRESALLPWVLSGAALLGLLYAAWAPAAGLGGIRVRSGMGAGGITAGALTVAQLANVAATANGLAERVLMGTYALLLPVLGFLIARTLSSALAGRPAESALPSLSLTLTTLRQRGLFACRASHWLGLLRGVFLFAAALVCVLLVFDARNRDFPLALFALPAVGLALLAMFHRSETGVEEKTLAWVILACVPFIAVNEHIVLSQHVPWHFAQAINADALLWCALGVLLAVPALRGRSTERARPGH